MLPLPLGGHCEGLPPARALIAAVSASSCSNNSAAGAAGGAATDATVGGNGSDVYCEYTSHSAGVPTVFKNISDRLDIGMGILFAKEVPAQLKQMGCDGFLVRMDMHGKDVTSKTELTKVEKINLPGSFPFSTPAGYKEDKNGGFWNGTCGKILKCSAGGGAGRHSRRLGPNVEKIAQGAGETPFVRLNHFFNYFRHCY